MERNTYTFPVGLVPQDPVQVRADHMREAGLDPESDFPPESYEHLVEIATTLTEDGPGDYGFQLHGHPFDWYTFIEPYTNALGGHEGEAGYFAEDYRSVNYDTETWKQVVADTIALYREHEVSGPQTPSIPDEDTVPLLTQGQVSMSPIEPMNYPTYHDTAPELMEAGDIKYGSLWSEPSGMNNAMLTYGLAITNPPEGADEDEWERETGTGRQARRDVVRRAGPDVPVHGHRVRPSSPRPLGPERRATSVQRRVGSVRDADHHGGRRVPRDPHLAPDVPLRVL